MTTLVDRERETYNDMWLNVEPYSKYSPGEAYIPLFLDMAQTEMRGSIIIAGCGMGKEALALRGEGFDVRMLIDLTDAGLMPEAKVFPFTQAALWDDLRQSAHCFSDWVYCCDVMEHLPKEFTMLAIVRMLQIAKRGVFLSIAFVPDQWGVWVGKQLHQTVEGFVWWRDNLSVVGRIKECRDLGHTGAFLVEPK